MMSNNARDIPQPHWVLKCCYQDLFELMNMHFNPYSKGRPTPEIVSLQNRIEELEEICDLSVTDYEYVFNQERVDPLTDEELDMFHTLKRKMPESFIQVSASEFFNTILAEKYNRIKSQWLVKNSIARRNLEKKEVKNSIVRRNLEKKDVSEYLDVSQSLIDEVVNQNSENKDVLETKSTWGKEGGLSPYTNLDEVFPPHSSQAKKKRLRKKLERRMKLIEKYS